MNANPMRYVGLAIAGLFMWLGFVPPETGRAASPALQDSSTVRLQQVVGGLTEPVFVTHAGDGSNRLFVVEKAGTIRIVTGGQVQSTPFLDIRSLVESDSFEQGLLGLSFHPSYESNGRFYVYYTAVNGGANTLAQFQVSADRNRADPNSRRVLFSIPDTYTNHNGGMLAFGPDGYLYVGTGDGGSAGDPDNNAQNLGSLLGKILRLDVNSDGTSERPYGIPSSNPFVTRSGARGEIWAYGLRNPWRWSFDRQSGDLFIGDVGQQAYEEISFQPGGSTGGQNYGWRIMEGLHCYNPASGCSQSGLTLPIVEYSHGEGCSVTGGYVYRGTTVSTLAGLYVHGDYCSGRIWSLRRNGSLWEKQQLLDTSLQISSFGEDEAGELYAVDIGGGAVHRFVSSGTTPPTVTPTPRVTATATPTRSPTSTPTPPPSSTPRPDVLITSFTANPTTVDRPFRITVTVKNQGNADTGAGDSFDVHVIDDLGRPPVPSDTRVFAHLEIPRLAAGASTTVSVDVPAEALEPGRHTLWALADHHEVVTESNEGNNASSIDVTIGAPAPSACQVGQYRAEYFNNRTLSGSPTFSQCEAAIDDDWGTGGPGNGLGRDDFSVRWTGRHTFAAGSYTFSATADDGVRLWLDGELIVDAWKDQGATTYRATRTLTAGDHEVKMEYYEHGGGAVARLSWQAGTGLPTPTPTPQPTGCQVGQYRAEYFNNRTLSGSPTFSQCEAAIDDDWGTGGPGNGLGRDDFSVRWTGRHTFAAGSYTFSATADDGVRLWLDGELIVDAWKDQGATTYRATRTLPAGEHEVKMEYYEHGGGAVARLSW
jgi:glucose/arabinose dehydrogenase